ILIAPHRSEIGWFLLSAVAGGAVSLLRRQRRQRDRAPVRAPCPPISCRTNIYGIRCEAVRLVYNFVRRLGVNGGPAEPSEWHRQAGCESEALDLIGEWLQTQGAPVSAQTRRLAALMDHPSWAAAIVSRWESSTGIDPSARFRSPLLNVLAREGQ